MYVVDFKCRSGKTSKQTKYTSRTLWQPVDISKRLELLTYKVTDRGNDLVRAQYTHCVRAHCRGDRDRSSTRRMWCSHLHFLTYAIITYEKRPARLSLQGHLTLLTQPHNVGQWPWRRVQIMGEKNTPPSIRTRLPKCASEQIGRFFCHNQWYTCRHGTFTVSAAIMSSSIESGRQFFYRAQ